MKNLQELKHQRGSLVDDMKGLLDKAEAENRDLNDSEREQYEKIDAEQAGLKNRIDNIQRVENLNKDLGSLEGKAVKPNTDGRPRNRRATDEYKSNFATYLQNPRDHISHEVLNALQVGTNSEGGYIVPEEFDTKIVEHLQNWNDFRPFLNVIQTSSDRNIAVEDTLGAAAYTAEEGAYNESDPAFGQKVLGAYKATRILKVSEELVEDNFVDNLFNYLARNFGKAFGLRQEQSIVAGTGSSQPNSLVSGASDSGVTFASTTAITSDELIDVYHGLTRPYRNNARWVMNDSTLKLIRKLKDSDGQYLWQPGLQAGVPDMLLGKPVMTSQYAPAAAAGNKSVIFGDLSGYTWAERSGRVVQRLNELYAANGQIGFRAYERHDGVVTDTSAIVYADQAAS